MCLDGKFFFIVDGTPPSVNQAYWFLNAKGRRWARKIVTPKAKEWIKRVQEQFIQSYGEIDIDDSRFEVNFKFCFTDKRKHDIDNLQKLTMDGLTGLLWKDDDLVVRLTSSKFRGDFCRTEIFARKIETEDW